MESNVYSAEETPPAAVEPVGLDRLEAAIQDLTAHDLDSLPDGVAAARVLVLRRLVDRLEGHWLRELAAVDGRGAAGAEDGGLVLCTASWLRRQLRLSKAAAHQAVQTARALFRGPLTGTAQALANGEVSAAHATVLAAGTADLPLHTTMQAEPVLLDAARRLDPPRLRRLVGHLRYVADPDAADTEAQRRYDRRGLWLAPTWEGMVAVGGLLDPRPARVCWPPWSPWPAPPAPTTTAAGISATPTRWPSWPAAASRPAACPAPVGCDPSCWSPWSWTACSADRAPLVGSLAGSGRCPPRPPSGWPATPP
jgi:hypothetical protein